jgi:rubrerythrin
MCGSAEERAPLTSAMGSVRGDSAINPQGRLFRDSTVRAMCQHEDVDDELWREAGDPVCWLRFVCPECGRMCEDFSLERCPNCGALIDENNPRIDPHAS